jgi:sugar phosphate isomerase/epimerase
MVPRRLAVFVAASTECFHDLPLASALERLADLEFTAVELTIFEDSGQLKPSDVLADVEAAVALCRNSRRLDVAAFDVRIPAEKAAHYEHFTAICKMAKAAKVVTITVPRRSGHRSTRKSSICGGWSISPPSMGCGWPSRGRSAGSPKTRTP